MTLSLRPYAFPRQPSILPAQHDQTLCQIYNGLHIYHNQHQTVNYIQPSITEPNLKTHYQHNNQPNIDEAEYGYINNTKQTENNLGIYANHIYLAPNPTTYVAPATPFCKYFLDAQYRNHHEDGGDSAGSAGMSY